MNELKNKESFFKKIKWINLLFLTIGGIINAIGVALLLSPMNLLDSGFSGTALLLDTIFKNLGVNFSTFSIFLIVLNFPFYILAVKKIGSQFMFYSLFAITIYSVMAFLFKDILDLVEKTRLLMTQIGDENADILLCAIFGGLLSGIGSGITIRYGGALDGVEVLAVLFAKKIGITVGTFVMIYNVILYATGAIVHQSIVEPLYSIIAYFIGIKTIDLLVEGLDKAKQVMIITSTPDEICKELSEQYGRGLTILSARGYYSQQDKTVIYCVANRFEIGRIKRTIEALDPNAFVSITETSETMDRKRNKKHMNKTSSQINNEVNITPEEKENDEERVEESITNSINGEERTKQAITNESEENKK